DAHRTVALGYPTLVDHLGSNQGRRREPMVGVGAVVPQPIYRNKRDEYRAIGDVAWTFARGNVRKHGVKSSGRLKHELRMLSPGSFAFVDRRGKEMRSRGNKIPAYRLRLDREFAVQIG